MATKSGTKEVKQNKERWFVETDELNSGEARLVNEEFLNKYSDDFENISLTEVTLGESFVIEIKNVITLMKV